MGYNNPAFVGDDNQIASTTTVTTDEVTRSPNEFSNGTTNGRTDTVNTISDFN